MSRGSSRTQEWTREPCPTPLVAGELGLQFYAGIPLRTREGYNLGTLCFIDREPRTLNSQDFRTLEDLAAIVMNDLEQRMQSRRVS